MKINREYDMLASEILRDIIKGEISAKTLEKMHNLTDYMQHIEYGEIDPMNMSQYYEILGKICVARKLFKMPIYRYIIGDEAAVNDVIYIDTDNIKKGVWTNGKETDRETKKDS